MISQVSQSYPLYARNGAQPTAADATAVTADPTTAVATPDATALPATPADAYTSSTALAPAPQVEEKAKPNLWAWGSLLAGGAAAIYWLATRGRGGAEVSKTVAEAAPKAAEAVAEAGQQVATAATKAVDDGVKAVSHMFGDIDLKGDPADIVIAFHRSQDAKQIKSAQKLLASQYNVTKGAIHVPYAQMPNDLKPPAKGWYGSTDVKELFITNSRQLETWKELALEDPKLAQQLANGRYVLTGKAPGGKLKYTLELGSVHKDEGIDLLLGYQRQHGDTALTKELAKKLGYTFESTPTGLVITGANGTKTSFASSNGLKAFADEAAAMQEYDFQIGGRTLPADEVKAYLVSLKASITKDGLEAHKNAYGPHTVQVGKTGNQKGVISIANDHSLGDEAFF